ncbi:HAD hydrolase family protein [Candidatus Sumerlaeota bacterium]|nr:HAD hydrolase family protein [Candidatus Sumerlaeota bacterium]
MGDEQLRQALARIRLLVLDVDGVMSDAGIFLGTNEEVKRYDSRDGVGTKYLIRNGVTVAVITGRESVSVTRRCAELGITHVYQRQTQKLPAFLSLVEQVGVAAEETAVMGDDLADLPMMRRAGLAVAVANAAEEVRQRADWVTRAAGGHGAIREVAEAILKAKGQWESLVERYLT